MAQDAGRSEWWCYHLHEARRVAEGTWRPGFRSHFTVPGTMSLLRGMNGAEPSCRRVLEYYAVGCL